MRRATTPCFKNTRFKNTCFTLVCYLTSLSPALAAAAACNNAETNVPCAQHAYSSVFQNSGQCSGFAMGMLDAPQGWKPAANLQGNWMQLDLLSAHTVGGVVTQAATETNDRVTKYKVSYSLDGSQWQWVEQQREFNAHDWNNLGNTRVQNTFATPVSARFVRIHPTGWYLGIRLRAGLLTCGDNDECALGTHDCGSGTNCINTEGSFTCTDLDECALGTHNCASGAECSNTEGSFICTDLDECALGTHNCPAGSLCRDTDGSFACVCGEDTTPTVPRQWGWGWSATSASISDHLPAVWFGDAQNDTLYDPWTPGPLPAWLNVGLRSEPRVIHGIYTQGGGRWLDKWTTSFKVQYEDEQHQLHWVDNGRVFQGNTDRYGVLAHTFNTPVTGVALQVTPLSGPQGDASIALRIRPRLCPPATTPPAEPCSRALFQACSHEAEQVFVQEASQCTDVKTSVERMQGCLVTAGCCLGA